MNKYKSIKSIVRKSNNPVYYNEIRKLENTEYSKVSSITKKCQNRCDNCRKPPNKKEYNQL